MERCMNCGSDDLIGLQEGFLCQRCGAMNNENGSCEYSPDGIEERIQDYDNYFENK